MTEFGVFDMKRSLQCIGTKDCGSRCVTYAQTGKLYKKDINCFAK